MPTVTRWSTTRPERVTPSGAPTAGPSARTCGSRTPGGRRTWCTRRAGRSRGTRPPGTEPRGFGGVPRKRQVERRDGGRPGGQHRGVDEERRAGDADHPPDAEVVGGDALEERPERVGAGEDHHIEGQYPAPEPVVDRQLDRRNENTGHRQVG